MLIFTSKECEAEGAWEQRKEGICGMCSNAGLEIRAVLCFTLIGWKARPMGEQEKGRRRLQQAQPLFWPSGRSVKRFAEMKIKALLMWH